LRGGSGFSAAWLLAQATEAILWKRCPLDRKLSQKLSAGL